MASTSSEKKSRKRLTLNEKLEIIKLSEKGMSNADIGRNLGLARQSVSTIVNDKVKYLKEEKSSTPVNTKTIRKRDSLIADMEKLLNIWIKDQTSIHVSLSQACIQNKALSLFNSMKADRGDDATEETFKASQGWFFRFKARSALHSLVVQGEAAGADKEAAENFTPVHIREMKKKWRHIRDSHVKYMQQTKNGHVKKKKYVYADELEFLEMGIKNRLLNGNINNNINVDNEWHELSGDGNDQEEELGGGQEENFTVKIENPISAVEVFLAEEDIKQDYSEVMDSIETELPTREISGVRSVKNFNPDDLPPSPRAKRPRLQELSDTMKQLKQMNESGLCGHDDNECDIFGRYVSAQLKKMSTEQCILSQEQIQAILTRSRLNDLRNQFSS